MTFRLCFFANFIIGSISQGIPAKWTHIIAFVFLEIAGSMDSAVMFCELKSISTNLGIPPNKLTDETEAI